MKNQLKIIVLSVFAMAAGSVLSADSDGEKLFKTNNPSESVTLLEQEIKEGKISSDTYNFLGLSYFQLGQYEKSIDAFERGMKSDVSNKKQLCFNEGNAAYKNGDYQKAESCYSLAVTVSPEYYEAVLNRANARLMLRKYGDAVADYTKFITARPDDEQADNIRKLIGYLQEQIVQQEEENKRLAEMQKLQEEENARLQAELAKQEAERKAEEEKLAAERAAELAKQEAEKARLEAERRAQEEERRRKILEDVANSLQQTDSTNMTAGAEDVLDYDYESELD